MAPFSNCLHIFWKLCSFIFNWRHCFRSRIIQCLLYPSNKNSILLTIVWYLRRTWKHCWWRGPGLLYCKWQARLLYPRNWNQSSRRAKIYLLALYWSLNGVKHTPSLMKSSVCSFILHILVTMFFISVGIEKI